MPAERTIRYREIAADLRERVERRRVRRRARCCPARPTCPGPTRPAGSPSAGRWRCSATRASSTPARASAGSCNRTCCASVSAGCPRSRISWRRSGITPERRVLDFAFVAAEPRVRRVLGTEQVLRVRRLNLADGEPFARVTVWCPATLGRPAVARRRGAVAVLRAAPRAAGRRHADDRRGGGVGRRRQPARHPGRFARAALRAHHHRPGR